MKFKEVKFRSLYHRPVVIQAGPFKEEVRDFPGVEYANRILAYGYVDHEKGLTFEVLACGVKKEDDVYSFFQSDDDVSVKIRAERLEGTEIEAVSGDLSRYQEKIDALKVYEENEELNKSREMAFLDPLRDPFYPDDIQVIIRKKKRQDENIYVRIEGLGEDHFLGKMLNEPYQDFDFHEGDTIGFYAARKEDGSVVCVADLDPVKAFTREELEDGSVLKEAISVLGKEPSQENYLEVIELLRDSFVWIPCTAVLSENDKKRVEDLLGEKKEEDFQKLIGQTMTMKDQIRMIPDILRNGDKYFFPVFTSDKEMGEYGEHFSKIEKSFLEAMNLAQNNDKNVTGIVVNPFGEAFMLGREFFDLVRQMKSRVVDNR